VSKENFKLRNDTENKFHILRILYPTPTLVNRETSFVSDDVGVCCMMLLLHASGCENDVFLRLIKKESVTGVPHAFQM
jgi:hypothetical protein